MSATIDILLATYNGARFVREQLDSLAAQTHRDWRLLVRDDGSTDDTMAIVQEWAKSCDRPVVIIEDGRKGLGASQNFGALLEKSSAPYFAFCDQDDFWLPGKLEVMLTAMRAEEAEPRVAAPVMVFSDLEVVDEKLDRIAASFALRSRRPVLTAGREMDQIMLHNPVPGCALLGNAALREASLPIPEAAVMHDWWVALSAGALGRVALVHRPLVQYRQHGKNTLGATNNGVAALAAYVLRDFRGAYRKSRSLMGATQRQAAAFADHHEDALPPAKVAMLRDYATLSRKPLLSRKAFFVRHRLLRRNLTKNLPFFVIA